MSHIGKVAKDDLKINDMTEKVILTTGIYDMIKNHVRRKKVTIEEENLLISELKNSKQVLRRDLPDHVVTVNRRVKIMDHTANKEQEYIFVPTTKTNPKKGKISILSDVAVAIIGRKEGDIIDWPFKNGKRKLEILKVAPI